MMYSNIGLSFCETLPLMVPFVPMYIGYLLISTKIQYIGTVQLGEYVGKYLRVISP